MARVRVTRAAEADLTEIWTYIAEDAPAAADKCIDKIRETIEMLAHNTGAGRSRDDLTPDMRSFRVGQYLIFYRIVSPRLDILRVLHGARDFRKILTTKHN